MKRREVLAFAVAAAVAHASSAHTQSGRVATIGVLWHAANADEDSAANSSAASGARKSLAVLRERVQRHDTLACPTHSA
jgi:hypothetical protein